MWQAYEILPEATLVGCCVHAKRKLHDATPTAASEKSLSLKGLNYCNCMFRLEEKWKPLSCEERYQARQQELKPLMQEFFDWCKQIESTILSNSKLSTAVNYAIRHQETFGHVLLDGNLELSNNMAERAVKSLVMGRKNWLFSQSFEGATASGIILSLIEIAKRNGLDPEKYLNYLLQKLPNEELLNPTILEAYLPWQEKIQAICK